MTNEQTFRCNSNEKGVAIFISKMANLPKLTSNFRQNHKPTQNHTPTCQKFLATFHFWTNPLAKNDNPIRPANPLEFGAKNDNPGLF